MSPPTRNEMPFKRLADTNFAELIVGLFGQQSILRRVKFEKWRQKFSRWFWRILNEALVRLEREPA
jgi:hypothetical protein